MVNSQKEHLFFLFSKSAVKEQPAVGTRCVVSAATLASLLMMMMASPPSPMMIVMVTKCTLYSSPASISSQEC